MKLTKEAAQSFVNLRANPDFAVILGWISDHRNKFRDECCTAEDSKLYRSQGKVEAVNGILKGNAEAPATLEKFKKQQ